jgi:hypothetical protein
MSPAISEWVGPRCSRNGKRIRKRISMSGITDNVKAVGILNFVFSRYAEALLERYANAM